MSAALPFLLGTAALAAVSLVTLPSPVGEVPITLQSAVVCFCGLTLGARRAAGVVGLYLALGAVGLPVFAGGAGGLDVLRGPTGGYLLGFLVALPLLGLGRLVLGAERPFIQASLASLLGHAAILAVGTAWLRNHQGWTWYRAIEVGCWPFLSGTVLKSLAVGFLVAWVARTPSRGRGR